MADGRAAGVIALPATSGVANFLFASFTITGIARNTRTRGGAWSRHCAFAELNIATTIVGLTSVDSIAFLSVSHETIGTSASERARSVGADGS
jgi:hypothetical protein